MKMSAATTMMTAMAAMVIMTRLRELFGVLFYSLGSYSPVVAKDLLDMDSDGFTLASLLGLHEVESVDADEAAFNLSDGTCFFP